MKEKIATRLFAQFLSLCIIRLFIIDGKYANMNITVILTLLGYAILFTVILECFDYIIVEYIKYYRYIVGFIMLIFIFFFLINLSLYIKIIFGYLFIIMIKDIIKLASMQLSLEEFQQNYKEM